MSATTDSETEDALETDVSDPTQSIRAMAFDEIMEMDDHHRRIRALAELVDAVQYRDGACFDTTIHDVVVQGFIGTGQPRLDLVDAHRHLADFANYYEGYRTDGDADLLKELTLGPGMVDTTDHTYYALHRLYKRAVREELEVRITRENVYNAVYERMWELCKDTRYIEYQMEMRAEYNCTAPHDFIIGGSETRVTVDWTMENVDRIAHKLIEASLGAFDNLPTEELDECYTHGAPAGAYVGEIESIIESVDGEEVADQILGRA